jgi:hypothetical protein
MMIPRIALWWEGRLSMGARRTGRDEFSMAIFDDNTFDNGIDMTRGRSLTKEIPTGVAPFSTEIVSEARDKRIISTRKGANSVQSPENQTEPAFNPSVYEYAHSVRSNMRYHMRSNSESTFGGSRNSSSESRIPRKGFLDYRKPGGFSVWGNLRAILLGTLFITIVVVPVVLIIVYVH